MKAVDGHSKTAQMKLKAGRLAVTTWLAPKAVPLALFPFRIPRSLASPSPLP
jgi:hypothetical protein